MKIRTRFLLFLFPTFVGGVVFVFSLFAYTWHEEMINLAKLTGMVDLKLVNEKFIGSLIPITISASFIILIMLITTFVIANKISRPIQKLNNSALALAAGQYGESIAAEGPKEIVELAGTLNIMSECLLENINRLKENAWLRERMYGEHECAMLLQHLMLQKNIDDCRSDAVAMQAITFFSDTPKGVLLKFPKTTHPDLFQIHLTEAHEEGLEGMYQLLTQSTLPQDHHTSITLDCNGSSLHAEGSNPPLLWSLHKKKWIPINSEETKTEPGDLVLLFTQGLTRLYKSPQHLEDNLSKVLKVFAQDGLKTTTSMLQKEISLLLKRKDVSEDIHLLCFQILYKNEEEEYSEPQENLSSILQCNPKH
jgi:HAMP domain-containing protein